MKASSLTSVLPRHFCTAESVSMLQIRVFKTTGKFSSERSKDGYEEGSKTINEGTGTEFTTVFQS